MRRLAVAVALLAGLASAALAQTSNTQGVTLESNSTPRAQGAVVLVPANGVSVPSTRGATAEAVGAVLIDPATGTPYKASSSGGGSVTQGTTPWTVGGSSGASLLQSSLDGGLMLSDRVSPPCSAYTLSGATCSGGVLSFTASGQTASVSAKGYAQLELTGGSVAMQVAVYGASSPSGISTSCAAHASNQFGTSGDATSLASTNQLEFEACGEYLQISSTTSPTGTQLIYPVLTTRPFVARSVYIAGSANLPSLPSDVASTTSTGTTAGTANTFSTPSGLASNSSRHGCHIVNKSTTNVLYVFYGSGTPSVGASVVLQAATSTSDGGYFDCGNPSGVVEDTAIQVASPGTSQSFMYSYN